MSRRRSSPSVQDVSAVDADIVTQPAGLRVGERRAVAELRRRRRAEELAEASGRVVRTTRCGTNTRAAHQPGRLRRRVVDRSRVVQVRHAVVIAQARELEQVVHDAQIVGLAVRLREIDAAVAEAEVVPQLVHRRGRLGEVRADEAVFPGAERDHEIAAGKIAHAGRRAGMWKSGLVALHAACSASVPVYAELLRLRARVGV